MRYTAVLLFAACAFGQGNVITLMDQHKPPHTLHWQGPSLMGEVTVQDYTPVAQGFRVTGKSVYNLFGATEPAIHAWYDATYGNAYLTTYGLSDAVTSLNINQSSTPGVGLANGYISVPGVISDYPGGNWQEIQTNLGGALLRGLAIGANTWNTQGGYIDAAPVTYSPQTGKTCLDAYGNAVGQPIPLNGLPSNLWTGGTQLDVLLWNASSPLQGYQSPENGTWNTTESGTTYTATWVSGDKALVDVPGDVVFLNGLPYTIYTGGGGGSPPGSTTTLILNPTDRSPGNQTGVPFGGGWVAGVYPIAQTPCTPGPLKVPYGAPMGWNTNAYFFSLEGHATSSQAPNAFQSFGSDGVHAAGGAYLGSVAIGSEMPAGTVTTTGTLTNPKFLGSGVLYMPGGPSWPAVGTFATTAVPLVQGYSIAPGEVSYNTALDCVGWVNQSNAWGCIGNSQWANVTGGISYNSGQVLIGETAHSGSPTSLLEVVSPTGQGISVVTYGANPSPTLILNAAEGSQASPTATLAGDVLGRFLARGYNGSAYTATSTGALMMVATENTTATNAGTKLQLYTTSNGSVTRALRMTIDQNGYVAIGSGTPAYNLDVTGSINASTNLLVATNQVVNTAGAFVGPGGVAVPAAVQSSGTVASAVAFQSVLSGTNCYNYGTPGDCYIASQDGQVNAMTLKLNAASGTVLANAAGSFTMDYTGATKVANLYAGSGVSYPQVIDTNAFFIGHGVNISYSTLYNTIQTTGGFYSSVASGNAFTVYGTGAGLEVIDAQGDIVSPQIKDTGLTSQSCIGTDSSGKLQAGTCGGSSQWTLSGSLLYPNSTGTKVLVGRTSDDSSGAMLQTSGAIHATTTITADGALASMAAGSSYVFSSAHIFGDGNGVWSAKQVFANDDSGVTQVSMVGSTGTVTAMSYGRFGRSSEDGSGAVVQVLGGVNVNGTIQGVVQSANANAIYQGKNLSNVQTFAVTGNGTIGTTDAIVFSGSGLVNLSGSVGGLSALSGVYQYWTGSAWAAWKPAGPSASTITNPTRAWNTVYTNSNSTPMYVTITAYVNGTGSGYANAFYCEVAGQLWGGTMGTSAVAGVDMSITLVVPAGATYQALTFVGTPTMQGWTEMY